MDECMNYFNNPKRFKFLHVTQRHIQETWLIESLLVDALLIFIPTRRHKRVSST